MPNYSLVRGRVMRVTRLNGCGNPVLGPDSVLATDGFVSVALTSNTDAGTTIQVVNAAGKVCILDQPTPKFVNYTVEVQFCGVNPQLYTMMSGQPVVTDAGGTNVVGFRQNSKVDTDLTGFALEVWTNVAGTACDPDGDIPYGYTLLPFIKGGSLGDLTFANDAINFTLSGAVTRDGSGWGVGPHKVTQNATGVDVPLKSAITAGDHLHTEIVYTAPPTPSANGNATALGTEATGATSGSPGTFTPANSYGPFDLAALQASSLTKTPTTAWASGTYVVLRDGSRAYWNGTAWVAGVAP